MFINIIDFPPIKAGKDTEFRQWFVWSNDEYARYEGFISRRLLLPTSYFAIQFETDISGQDK